MSDAITTHGRFTDKEEARAYLEQMRWPQGSICPHCGSGERNSPLQGRSHRAGLYYCGNCRQQFTVTVGTVFERSKIPLNKWLYAVHLICSHEGDLSCKQIEYMLGVTYKTAWFMLQRIREAMD